MAQYRPFAIWDGESTIPSGVNRIQNILIGVADRDYHNFSGFDWWAGADESLGYIIAYHDPTFSQPNQLEIPCGIGFLRSETFSDASFLELFNHLMAKLSLTPILNANDAKTWLLSNGYWTSYGETPWEYGNSGGSGGSNNGSGLGSWYFYSDAGQLNAPPPVTDGNAIFIIRDNQNNTMTETFNPNKSSGTNEIYFNLSDSTGTDYTTQFTALQTNGGTISITQGANTVTYASATPGSFIADTMAGFFMIQTGPATQTATSASPFVYGDPISISFS